MVELESLMEEGIRGRAIVNAYLLGLAERADGLGRIGLRREATLLRERYHNLCRICEEMILADTGGEEEIVCYSPLESI